MTKRKSLIMVLLGGFLAAFALALVSAPAHAAGTPDLIKFHRNASVCLDDPGGRTDLIVWQCHGRTNQQWDVGFTPRGTEPGWFSFRNVASGRCIDATPEGVSAGVQMQMRFCDPNNPLQMFIVDYAFNDGHWHQAWRNVATGNCMDLMGGVANNRPVVSWPCNRTDAQLWRFVDA